MKRYSREEQTYHVTQWRKSGLSQRAYCEQNRISWSTFKNWNKRIQQPPKESLFAPIQITPSTHAQWIIEAADGLRVHVPVHCDENNLKTLINALRSRDAT
jgi:hypothetical protein